MGLRQRDMPALYAYSAAYKRWENTKKVRGRAWDCRPLGDVRRHNYMRIEKTYGDVIDCVLYDTACVRFHPTGEIEINPYPSKSTNDFINTILRELNVEASFLHDDHNMFWMRQFEGNAGAQPMRGYGITSQFKFRRDVEHPGCYVVDENSSDTDKFAFTKINRAKAKLALAGTNYPQLSLWINAVRAIGGRNALIFPKVERYGFQIRHDSRKHMHDDTLIECLAKGPDGWKRMAETRGPGCVDEVRMALYAKAGDVFEVDMRPYLEGRPRDAYLGYLGQAKKFYNYI